MKRINKYTQKRKGIMTPYGQWKYPGEVTTIPDNRITMKGVPYPVLGVSDKGDTKMMLPGMDYLFKGKNVTEYPMMQDGGEVQEEFKYVPSQMILDKMKGFEGFRPRTYWDSVGKKWTVGYGFTDPELVKKYKDTDMTSEEADKYFRDEVNKRISNFLSLTPNYQHLNQNQLDALFDLYYNVGSGTYSQKSPSMQQALREMNWEEVTNQMDHGMKQAEGLRLRRLFDQELFRTPYMVPEPEEYAKEEDVVSDNVLPMQTGGEIHIKEKNRGKFTEAAHRAGKSVQAYAAQILANKENYSPALVKRANFARNAAKWKHQTGGIDKYLEGNYIQPKTIDNVMGAWNDQLAKGFAKGDMIANHVGNALNAAATASAAVATQFGKNFTKDIMAGQGDEQTSVAAPLYWPAQQNNNIQPLNNGYYGFPVIDNGGSPYKSNQTIDVFSPVKGATGGNTANNVIELERGEIIKYGNGDEVIANDDATYHEQFSDNNEKNGTRVMLTGDAMIDTMMNPALTFVPGRKNKYTIARHGGREYMYPSTIQLSNVNAFGVPGLAEPKDGLNYPLAKMINKKMI